MMFSTDAERLMQYRNVLAKEGVVRLKTDSQPLFDFSLEQVEVAVMSWFCPVVLSL